MQLQTPILIILLIIVSSSTYAQNISPNDTITISPSTGRCSGIIGSTTIGEHGYCSIQQAILNRAQAPSLVDALILITLTFLILGFALGENGYGIKIALLIVGGIIAWLNYAK